MDSVTQRVIATWAFIFLVGWWLSQIAFHSLSIHTALSLGAAVVGISRDFVLLIQWIILLNAFLAIVYILQIPMLRFRLNYFLVGIVVITTLQMLIFFPSSPISVRQVTERMYWKSVERMEERRVVTVSDNTPDDPHTEFSGGISGSFTVKVIPYSLAELNPEAQTFCLPLLPHQTGGIFGLYGDTRETTIEIPALLSGVPPWTLEYSFLDFFSQTETNHSVVVNYVSQADANVVNDVLQESKHKWFNIPITAPGILTLHTLADEKGDGVVSQGSIEVSVCPEAFWKRDNENKITSTASLQPGLGIIKVQKCQSENMTQSILVYGVPPLSVTYYHKKGTQVSEKLSIQHIDQDYDYDSEDGSSVIRALGSANAFVVDLADISFDSVGMEYFFVSEVIDGKGLKKIYVENKTADLIEIEVKDRPKASLGGESELFVVSDDDGRTAELLNLPVQFSGNPPFSFDFLFTDPNGKAEVLKRTNIFTKTYAISTDRIGTYRLKSVSDSSCVGSVLSHEVKILRILPPSINVEFAILDTPCVGHIGFSAKIKLTGKGPWTVLYEMKSDRGEKKRLSAVLSLPSDTIEIKPPNAGTYTVTFLEFRDSKYPHSIQILDASSTQSFHAPASAVLERSPSKLCAGSSAEIQVRLGGKKPWKLAYDIVSPTSRASHVHESDQEGVKLNVGPFVSAGRHYIEFTSLQDSSGCEANLKLSPALIEVLQQQTVASFKTRENDRSGLIIMDGDSSDGDLSPLTYWMVEGKPISIPIDISGSGAPWTITLEYRQTDSDKWTSMAPMTFRKKDASFSASRHGFYRIKEVKDDVCPGSVGSPSEITTKVLAKPRASIISVQNVPIQQLKFEGLKTTAVCVGTSASMKIKFEGKPPFTLNYQVSKKICDQKSNCEFSKHTLKQIKVSQHNTLVDLQVSDPGEYKYEALSVSDGIYENVQLDHASNTFHHLIHEQPNVKFSDGIVRSVCVGHGYAEEKLPNLLLTSGSEPATVSYEMIVDGNDNQKQPKTQTMVMETQSQTFNPISSYDTTGGYLYKLKSVTDINGCGRTFTPDDYADFSIPRVFRVKVSREPAFSPLSSVVHGCIGDKIGFLVQGSPPWIVKYTWSPLEGPSSDLEINVSEDDSRSWITSHLFSYIQQSAQEEIVDQTAIVTEGVNKSRKIFVKFAKPGKMVVKEVCHGDEENSCCIKVNNWEFEVHPVPFAKVSGGSNGEDVIRQGSEAKMLIEFKGISPYSFTYSRVSDGGAELESHVITNITDSTYALSVNQAGKFVVTSISDKYCKYP